MTIGKSPKSQPNAGLIIPFKARKFEKLNLQTLQESGNPYLKQKYHFEKLATQQDLYKKPTINAVDTQRGNMNFQESSKIDLNSIHQ